MKRNLLLVAIMFMVSGCASETPPPPGPATSSAGGITGAVNKAPAQVEGAFHPTQTHATPVSTGKKAVNEASDDINDWINSSWKLFKSSVRSTTDISSHQIHSPQGNIHFTNYQPISLDVSNINVVDAYKSPMREPHVEHLLHTSPSEAMHIWVKDRLRSIGSDKTLQVTIKDASVVAAKLPAEEDADAHYRRYDARLEVDMRIYGPGSAMSLASITVVATQSNSIAEEVSLAQRKAIFRTMMYDLMVSANAELEKQIFKYFTQYINYAQTP
jgi:hypothetical protein